VEAYRSAKIDDVSPKYAFSIYLGEVIESDSTNTYLPFMVDVESKPEGAFFKITGKIFINGPRKMVKKLIASKDNEPPEIWSRVYEETLQLLSSLADSIQVPPPTQLENL
jgi:hypothetical protein